MITQSNAAVAEDYALTPGEEQYLTFELAGEEYAVSILKVQEIRVWDRVTPIPNSPRYVKGVLNLRGTIVPIVDLRLRFNLEARDVNEFTVIVVVNVNGRLAGLVVDAVQDVVSVPSEQHSAAPEYEGQQEREFIKGLAQNRGHLLVLLDVEKLVDPDGLGARGGSNIVVS